MAIVVKLLTQRLFLTVVCLKLVGVAGWKKLLDDRKEVYDYLKEQLSELGNKHGEQVLHTPNNPISLALTLSNFGRQRDAGNKVQPPAEGFTDAAEKQQRGHASSPSTRSHPTPSPPPPEGSSPGSTSEDRSAVFQGVEALIPSMVGQVDQSSEGLPLTSTVEEILPREKGEQEMVQPDSSATTAEDLTFLGSMLFLRRVSGCRIIPRGEVKTVAGVQLVGFGSSFDCYPVPYLTAAAAIGATRAEVDAFVAQLHKCLQECEKKRLKKSLV
eukprot:TRINITY_DN9504_c0_g2_i2.p1 TRINITY_DN9504_c0_g2~~TRINITY_DN9504_c0_g2_i2.p1  ORF type:complete len:271 (-),score=45.23 TRINITY_DN9504_c0_g2_i2:807-1619(-)